MNRLLLICISSLAACATTPGSVVVVQLPPSPTRTIVIIPAAYNNDELDFAARVESVFIKARIPVIERPTFKFMSTDKLQTTSESNSVAVGGNNWVRGRTSGNSVSEPLKIMDVVAMYPDTKATHIAVTYASGKRIRIIEKSTDGVIATLELKDNQTLVSLIYSALIQTGLVPGTYEAKLCQPIKAPFDLDEAPAQPVFFP